ncbi:MAG: hypothetical protein NT125_08575 [Candidatus Bipolaricaulota bacterium]|nr:hypothetical protein [Candidatus Bipolaricaulota bacterium]
MNYCHPMYGGQFMQGFGWYVNQAFYRLGVDPRARWESPGGGDATYVGHAFLPDLCPNRLRELVEREQSVTLEYRFEADRLLTLVRGPSRDDIKPDEVTFWSNVKIEESAEYTRLRRAAAQAARAVTAFVENAVRQEFGFRKVGEGWVSETLLSMLVSRLLPESEMLRHQRPEWLEGLELDIYLPALRLGIEYQGQQHFHPVEAWGGKSAPARVRLHDARKAELCRAADVILVTVDYTEPLTEEHLAERLAEALPGQFPEPRSVVP